MTSTISHSLLPKTEKLREALESILAADSIAGLPIVEIERSPSAYSSTYPLENIRVLLSDGSPRELVFKNVSLESLSATARLAKPEFLYDPLREIEAYRLLLRQTQLGTAKFYGAFVDRDAGKFWIFLERILGEELYKIGEFSVWEAVARWLARMHRQFTEDSSERSLRSMRWLNFNAEYYWTWMRRAQQSSETSVNSPLGRARGQIGRLASRYGEVVHRLTALPSTIIHGEFYPSNVLISRLQNRLRICPVDWEMTAIGPGLIDLAALVSGRWNDTQRTALAKAYFQSIGTEGHSVIFREEEFLAALDDCRLHLAIQWLGWSETWTPPADHAHNWLEEALELAQKVGCL
jgi:hypothetical protein